MPIRAGSDPPALLPSASCESPAFGLHPADNVFALPLLNRFLIYAPLHHLAALVDRAAMLRLQDSLSGKNIGEGPLGEIAHTLASNFEPAPLPRRGNLAPAFLGLLPTRGCNLDCRYCGFLTPDESQKVMDLELARDAVSWYMDLVRQSGSERAEIHYFGGEPFCADQVLDLTVPFARIKAREIGCALRFEAATNGTFSQERCQWAADNLDTIVLSLDGPADIQERHRPCKNGESSFDAVIRNARILSEGAAALCFRACVTGDTVGRMPEIAEWFCRDFRPSAVSFEPVQPSLQSRAAQLDPPDPWAFAQNFVSSARILEAHGVEPIYASSDIRALRVSFCPVGQDVVIVSPDGGLSACYLLQRDWEAQGLDLRLGCMNGNAPQFDEHAVAFARSLNVWSKPLCAHCFCKWHCAGGCHVNHALPGPPGAYDRLCIQTRIIALRNILKAMGQDALAWTWLHDRPALERTAHQGSDALLDREAGL